MSKYVRTYKQTVCVNQGCNNKLGEFELGKQDEYPRTLKYKLCLPCKKRRKTVVLACANCGILSINIVQKYCHECSVEMKAKCQKIRYDRLHPRGKCKNCEVQLDPKLHGKKHKYCSNDCMLAQRRIMSRGWSQKYKAKVREHKKKYSAKYFAQKHDEIVVKNQGRRIKQKLIKECGVDIGNDERR